jgi:hypothetical protein
MLAGTLMPTYLLGAFEPAGLSEADERKHAYPENGGVNSCFGQNAIVNLAYIPEQDLQGVSVTGSRQVTRYDSGPYAGKIRLDSRVTIMNAISNQVENAALHLRTGPPSPAFLYTIGFKNPTASDSVESLGSLQSLANDPAGPVFMRHQPAGLAILTDDPEGFWPAFQRVRQDIVEHATIHSK